MKTIRWNIAKSELLKETRGVSFEDILNAKLISLLEHPVKVNQKIMLFEYKNYIWVVPFVEEKEYIFLKTIFPSR
jgi:hypothetical protein